MPDVRFDTYYRYEDLTRILQEYAEGAPNLVRLESIGQSYEGRDIWLATVTNFDTGEADTKPAFWVDGNIHAAEVSPSSTCLYLIHHLVSGYGSEPDVTRCMDTRAFYICPRVNPDGAELALADKPKLIRSSTRPYPYDEEPIGGLVREDIDGDGRMLMMRIPDPNGPWKACEEEPRLLVRRGPTEAGGQYYRLLPEGQIEDYDGVLIQVQQNKEGLDLNRNFPVNWRQEYEQRGAGPYPTSEPEIHAVARFIAGHPNITGGAAFHTWSGVLLRPYGDQSDETLPAEDLWTYEKIGQKGTEITGYPAISVYHDFRYHPRKVITGTFNDWLYDQMGGFAWVVEIWNPQRQAGVESDEFIDWMREHPLEDDLKMLKWSDEVLEGKGYVDWYPYEHPQLGPVELGGWDYLYAFRNPPPELLEKEIAPFADWLVWHLLISPCLELYEVSTKPLGKDTYHVRMVVQNTGWLPTYVTKRAAEKKLTRGIVCEIDLPEGASLEAGKLREELGELEGRAYKPSSPGGFSPYDATDERAKAEWVVHAPEGGTVKLTARHERAGIVTTEVKLR
jgi:murein tripeptide amidase MpaA